MGRKAVDTNQVFIDGLKVPLEDRIGEEGKGFHYLLHGLNPERILIAAEAIGIGKAALAKATQYAKERIVFGRPIGKNQAIDRKSTRLNSSHRCISYAVFCLKKKNKKNKQTI